ncbi:NACHT, LRR and PYD domains-containing protein 6-like [Engraulis encrasicolus]|uniref:NACHT, LRR and PYD domains-containing protein 6-like n=1 Tax=Engraulis encrasicolus TaxID=184585 RepID=UPI002FD5CD1C
MSADLKDVMRRTLDDLTESDFKRFKHYLRDYCQQGESRIAWGRLERADQYDTVDLIVQVYHSDPGDTMLSVLQKMNQNQLARSFEKDLDPDGANPHH